MRGEENVEVRIVRLQRQLHEQERRVNCQRRQKDHAQWYGLSSGRNGFSSLHGGLPRSLGFHAPISGCTSASRTVTYRTHRSQRLSPFRNRRALESTSCGGETLSSALGRLKIVLVCAQIGALACLVQAQTYKVGDSSAPKSQSPQSNNADQAATPSKPETQPPNKALGWGSNIQNARLARAAEQALKNRNFAAAVD